MDESTLQSILSSVLDRRSSDIDLSASFIQNGGDSLSAASVVRSCKGLHIALNIGAVLRCNKLIQLCFDSPHVGRRLTAEKVSNVARDEIYRVEESRPSKRGCWKPLEGPRVKRLRRSSLITSVPQKSSSAVPDSVSMTEMQLTLIHGSLKNPGVNVITFLDHCHPRDLSARRSAWESIIRLETAFNVEFDLAAGRMRFAPRTPEWIEDEVNSEAEYQAILGADSSMNHTLFTKFRVVKLLDVDGGVLKGCIVWIVNHALVDGFSCGIIQKKVQMASQGLDVSPGPSILSILSELSSIKKSSRLANRRYWLSVEKTMSKAIGDLRLLPRKTKQQTLVVPRLVPCDFPTSRLHEESKRLNVTVATLVYAAWSLTLAKYSDSTEVVFGVILAGRNASCVGIEDTIGAFITALPLCVSIDPSSSSAEFLQYIQQRLLELIQVELSEPEDGFRRDYISSVTVAPRLPGHGDVQPELRSQSMSRMMSDNPLTLIVDAEGIEIQYDWYTFEETQMRAIGHSFSNVLLQLLNSAVCVAELLQHHLPASGREDVLQVGNLSSEHTRSFSVREDLVTLFEKVASEQPELIALCKGGVSMTYGDLDVHASRVATSISQYATKGEVICIHADRSINWIIAIYAVLKSGCVYCPLDEKLALTVRNANFDSSGSKVYIAVSDRSTFIPDACAVLLNIDDIISDPYSQNNTGMAHRCIPSPSSSAYLCFTSGSTGKPKGVLCSHAGLVAFQSHEEVRLSAAPGRRIAQIMSPAFDGSIHEIFSALSYGATLVLQDGSDPFQILSECDVALVTPSVARVLDIDSLPNLKRVYLVGEVVSQDINDTWASKTELYNMYGPTEATCGATIQRLRPGIPVTIGRPNPSTRVYILDREKRLLPKGLIGEIYLAGVQVSRGYIGLSVQTTERFMTDHLSNFPGELIYKTGDFGHWTTDGEIVCLGRSDRQIKLRGFRIDLDDIEARIAASSKAVDSIRVMRRKDWLLCMVTPGSVNLDELRSSVQNILPWYAVPKDIVAVNELPINVIGKVDDKRIAAGVSSGTPSLGVELTSLEIQIADLWRDILSLQSDMKLIGSSSFESLGGSSLAQLQLSARLSTMVDRDVPLCLIMSSPTLSALARSIEKLVHSIQPSVKRTRSEICRVSAIEREWWNAYQSSNSTSAFNVSYVCRLDLQTNRSRLESAWNTVLHRHEMFRCTYSERDGQVVRLYKPEPPQVQLLDEEIDVRAEINHPFDLQRDNLIRTTISRNHLTVVVSHIICDLTTLETILEEVSSEYHGNALSPVFSTYPHLKARTKLSNKRDRFFWQDYLKRVQVGTSSVTGQSNLPKRRDFTGASHVFAIPHNLAESLTKFSSIKGYTLHQIALAASALALQPGHSNTDIVLGAPFLNRHSEQELRSIGLFLEPIPIRIQFDENMTLTGANDQPTYIDCVRQSSQAALSHAIDNDQLCNILGLSPRFLNHELLEYMVTFHDNRSRTQKITIPGLSPLYTWTEGSKFKLMVEFTATTASSILVRVEYSDICFSKRDVKLLESLLLGALSYMGRDLPYHQMRENLLRLREQLDTSRVEEAQIEPEATFFARSIDTL